MKTYVEFVQGIQDGLDAARDVAAPTHRAPVEERERKVLLFSPHPDDECITGLLPLRLARECNVQVINVPVTFGSNVARQAARAAELADACAYLGWSVYRDPPGHASLTSADVTRILERFQPTMVVVPHVRDWNPRHISTHKLVVESLRNMDTAFCCDVVETEFWGAMDDPNLVMEADTGLVAELVAATSLHVGEVARNPYHLTLPAWMQDNVRRGGELAGGAGAAVPTFTFATLYRYRRWSGGELTDSLQRGCFVPVGDPKLEELFQWR